MTTPVFEPARLRLARELAEATQSALAEQLGVSAAAVSQYESGAARPSQQTLAELCSLLAVPPNFFTTPLLETHEGFFRSLRRTPVGKRRQARGYGHVAHDIATHSAVVLSLPTLSLPKRTIADLDVPRGDVEQIASDVRREWVLPAGPVSDVVGLLEQHGAVVMRLPLVTTEVDAFSLPFADHPVVVLSADKNDRARSRFDAAHELGHLVMHGDQVWGLREVETQAHWFAAAFLMPAPDIHDELPTKVDWPRLFELKKRWQVSLAALLLRAKSLGRINDAQYVTAVKTASARGWRRVEPVPLGAPEQPKLLSCALDTLTNLGLDDFLPTFATAGLSTANR